MSYNIGNKKVRLSSFVDDMVLAALQRISQTLGYTAQGTVQN